MDGTSDLRAAGEFCNRRGCTIYPGELSGPPVCRFAAASWRDSCGSLAHALQSERRCLTQSAPQVTTAAQLGPWRSRRYTFACTEKRPKLTAAPHPAAVWGRGKRRAAGRRRVSAPGEPCEPAAHAPAACQPRRRRGGGLYVSCNWPVVRGESGPRAVGVTWSRSQHRRAAAAAAAAGLAEGAPGCRAGRAVSGSGV